MSLVRSLLFSTPLLALATIFMGTISLVASLFDRTGGALHWLARMWGKMVLALCFIRIRAEGIEKLDPHGVYVYACNHGSFLDIPALLSVLPYPFRFFAKAGLFRIPFLGTHLKRAGHLSVDQSSVRASLKTMTAGARMVAEHGVSVLIFPEGGRSEGGLREFSEGAAYIAIKSGAPILPVGIIGLRELLPMGATHIRTGRVTIRVGDPIPAAGMTLADRVELTQRTYDEIAKLMGLDVSAEVKAQTLQ